MSDLENYAFRSMCFCYPHEMYDENPEKFWEYFRDTHPEIPRHEMERLLRNTRPQPKESGE